MADSRDPNATRRRMNQIQAAPVIIDVAGNVLDLETLQNRELTHPPAPVIDPQDVPTSSYRIATYDNSCTELDAPIDPNSLNLMFHQTWPARIKSWYADGEGVVITLGAAVTGVFVGFVVKLTLAAIAAYYMVTGAVITYGPTVLGLLVILGIVGVVFSRRDNGLITVKGCAKSGFAGPQTIRR
jgi:hypothetical protein